MERQTVHCIAKGRPGDWEAICLDFDISVQGASFEEVQTLLSEAIDSYVEFAEAADVETRRRLLSRRAPFHVIVKERLGVMLYKLKRKLRNGEEHRDFVAPCLA